MARKTTRIVTPLGVKPNLEDWRCPRCSRLLVRVRLWPGTRIDLEIICERCGALMVKQVQVPRESADPTDRLVVDLRVQN